MKESAMTDQRPEVHPGYGEDLAESNGFADDARHINEDEADAAPAQTPTEPPDEASTPA
jgi:hypothetical protein